MGQRSMLETLYFIMVLQTQLFSRSFSPDRLHRNNGPQCHFCFPAPPGDLLSLHLPNLVEGCYVTVVLPGSMKILTLCVSGSLRGSCPNWREPGHPWKSLTIITLSKRHCI
ncbi:hypothetical protein LDENG_00119240 [Lucifuga dentata]|nr:hypothetical protein LDENG_00119240 [Lucifuga dentata]